MTVCKHFASAYPRAQYKKKKKTKKKKKLNKLINFGCDDCFVAQFHTKISYCYWILFAYFFQFILLLFLFRFSRIAVKFNKEDEPEEPLNENRNDIVLKVCLTINSFVTVTV